MGESGGDGEEASAGGAGAGDQERDGTHAAAFVCNALADAGEVDIRRVQERLGHADIRTTEAHVKLARAMRGAIISPLDDR